VGAWPCRGRRWRGEHNVLVAAAVADLPAELSAVPLVAGFVCRLLVEGGAALRDGRVVVEGELGAGEDALAADRAGDAGGETCGFAASVRSPVGVAHSQSALLPSAATGTAWPAVTLGGMKRSFDKLPVPAAVEVEPTDRNPAISAKLREAQARETAERFPSAKAKAARHRASVERAAMVAEGIRRSRDREAEVFLGLDPGELTSFAP
jgi:hypothetical protein